MLRRGHIALLVFLAAGCHLALPLSGGAGEAGEADALPDAARDGSSADGRWPGEARAPDGRTDAHGGPGFDGSAPGDLGDDGKNPSPCLAPGGKGWDCYLPSSGVCEDQCTDGALTFVIRCDQTHCECEVSGVLVGSCPFSDYFNKCTTCSGAGWSCCISKF